jgi:hypothetical protein
MRALLAVAIIAVGLLASPGVAASQERLGDGAMGAAAGALVGGPVGAIAGGLVGYTLGPNIAHAWGLHRYRHRDARRLARREQAAR